MRRSKLIFHPVFVSVCALMVILFYAAWTRWRFPGGDLSNHYIYVLPIIFPFVTFLFDRAQGIRQITLVQLIVEFLVVGLALTRMFGHVPLMSGHALFLTYAIAGPGSRLTRITAALVMIQVIYLKFFVWHDLVSPVTGIFLGLLGATIVWVQRNKRRQAESQLVN